MQKDIFAVLYSLHRIRKWLVIAAGVGVLAGMLFLFALWIEHNQPMALPPPTGPFMVGLTSLV